MRDHFWRPDMSGVDWDGVLDRYRPVLDRLATHDDLVDLLWEVHGELGTSHAYVTPPLRPPPRRPRPRPPPGPARRRHLPPRGRPPGVGTVAHRPHPADRDLRPRRPLPARSTRRRGPRR